MEFLFFEIPDGIVFQVNNESKKSIAQKKHKTLHNITNISQSIASAEFIEHETSL